MCWLTSLSGEIRSGDVFFFSFRRVQILPWHDQPTVDEEPKHEVLLWKCSSKMHCQWKQFNAAHNRAETSNPDFSRWVALRQSAVSREKLKRESFPESSWGLNSGRFKCLLFQTSKWIDKSTTQWKKKTHSVSILCFCLGEKPKQFVCNSWRSNPFHLWMETVCLENTKGCRNVWFLFGKTQTTTTNNNNKTETTRSVIWQS